jgi:hypothetical protein
MSKLALEEKSVGGTWALQKRTSTFCSRHRWKRQGKTAAICTFHIMSLYCMSLSPGFSSLSCNSIAASYAFHAAFIRLRGKQHNVHSALANLLILRIQG